MPDVRDELCQPLVRRADLQAVQELEFLAGGHLTARRVPLAGTSVFRTTPDPFSGSVTRPCSRSSRA